ncbi:MAG: GGDEF domain-containing phosphodiesterase [Eubacterium sp.]|nr:GGDEF domain-containing phosphodiesterase [Eubacterium sp.]
MREKSLKEMAKKKRIILAEKMQKNTEVEGLLGREEYIEKAIGFVKKYQDNKYLALIIAIKDFDAMKRLYGEEQGEKIVKLYAEELVRRCDQEELVGHRGNDKFALLVKKKSYDEINNLLDNFEVHLDVDGKQVDMIIRTFAGVAPIDATTANTEKLVVEPRLALSYGVNNGERVVFISEEICEQMVTRRRIEDMFPTALKEEYIQLWLQPKIDIRTDKIIGVEALARWIEPDCKYFPGEFVPVLEQAGLIDKLDFYVLERACKFMSVWQEKGNELVPLSVNFSRVNLKDEELADKINAVVEKYHIDKKKITVEITETVSQKMNEKMHYFLEKMRANGIRTSVDDFGTGYASLSMLRDFTMDEIKIDRSFITAALFQEKGRIIVKGIADMAKDLGMNVIVEGVETEEQKEFLREIGCYYVQGYLYDKPLARDQFEERLLKGYR